MRSLWMLGLAVLIALIGGGYLLANTSAQIRKDAIIFCELRNDAVVSQNEVANTFRNFMKSLARRSEEVEGGHSPQGVINRREYAKFYREYASQIKPAVLIDCEKVLTE